MRHSTTELYHHTEAANEGKHLYRRSPIRAVSPEHKRIYARLPAMQHLPRSCLTTRIGHREQPACSLYHEAVPLYRSTQRRRKTHKQPKQRIQKVGPEHKRIYAQLPAMQHLPRSCLATRVGCRGLAKQSTRKQTKGGIKGGIKAISSIIARDAEEKRKRKRGLHSCS